MPPPPSLTAATAIRSTRFGRTRAASFVLRAARETLTGFGSILRPTCIHVSRPTLPESTASSLAFVTTYDRPFSEQG